MTEVLDLAKEHQKGRVTENVTDVSFNFTEGWFRTSGIYDLAKIVVICQEKLRKENKIENAVICRCKFNINLLPVPCPLVPTRF